MKLRTSWAALADEFRQGLLKSILSVSFWSGVGKLLSFFSSLLLARILAPDQFGQLAMMMVIVSGISVLFDPRLYQFIVPEMIDHARRRELALVALIIELCAAALGTLLALALYFLGIMDALKLPASLDLVWFIGIYLLGFGLSRGGQAIFQGHKRFTHFNAVELAPPTFYLAFLGSVFLLTLDADATFIFSARALLVLSVGVAAVLGVRALLAQTDRAPLALKTLIKPGIKVLHHWSAALVVGMLAYTYMNADRYLLSWLAKTSADVGLYVVGVSLGFLLIHFTTVMMQVLFPNFAEAYKTANDQKIKAFLSLYNRFIFYLVAPLAIVLAMLSEGLITLLFGEDYRDASTVFEIWILFIPLLVSPDLIIRTIFIEKDQRKFARSMLMSSLLNIGLTYLLIPYWGKTGAIIGTISAFSTQLVFFERYGRQKLGYRLLQPELLGYCLVLAGYAVIRLS